MYNTDAFTVDIFQNMGNMTITVITDNLGVLLENTNIR